MTKNRQKISLLQITQMFPDDATAEQWFMETRWPHGVNCPVCGSCGVSSRKTVKRAWRCRDCRKDFSTKTATLMQGSNLFFRTWAIAIYLLTTNLKGIASTKLASDLGITQKSAWHLTMRIRETYGDNIDKLSGVIEVDETYIGGKEKNKHSNKQLKSGRGPVGKTAVIGAKQRSGKITAGPIDTTDGATLKGFIHGCVNVGSTVYTDEHKGYTNLGGEAYRHGTVNHSRSEYVNGMVHTNGIESFWALLKRGYYGTHHHMSEKHLHRYVNEFAGRHNSRSEDTLDQMKIIAANMSGSRLRYSDLVA